MSPDTVTVQEEDRESKLIAVNEKLLKDVEHWKGKFLTEKEKNAQLISQIELLQMEFDDKSQTLKNEVDHWKNRNGELSSQIKLTQEEFESKFKKFSEEINDTKKENIDLRLQTESMQKKLSDWEEKHIDVSDRMNSKRKATCAQHSTKQKILKENNVFEVDSLLKHRKRNGKLQYLIHWKNYGSDHDSWQSESNLNCSHLLKEYKKANNLN